MVVAHRWDAVGDDGFVAVVTMACDSAAKVGMYVMSAVGAGGVTTGGYIMPARIKAGAI